MTDEELIAEVEKLDAATLAGPWEEDGQSFIRGAYFSVAEVSEGSDEARFIARARTLLPELAKRLRESKQREAATAQSEIRRLTAGRREP